MHEELPDFKICCFCLPLRRNLVGWGYYRLAIDVLFTICYTFYIIQFCHMTSLPNAYEYSIPDMILSILVTIYYFIDSVFAIFLIVGGHKKIHVFSKYQTLTV